MKQDSQGGKWLVWAWGVVSLALTFYSFTQVDLGMTLTSASVWATIQQKFQYIGYFQRPLSAGIYAGILVSMTILYVFTLFHLMAGKLSRKVLWRIILLVAVILTVSYPAFSKDFFNYLFTAKTVLLYGKNPYLVTPLDFTGVDPWLGFLHWTHLPSAYTPLWITVTLPLYLIGSGIFPFTILLFKLFFTMVYLATAWVVEKTLSHVDREHASFGLAVFALSPLVLIEAVASPHNDSLMALFAIGAYLLYRQKHVAGAYLSLALSVGVKMMTGILYPVIVFGFRRGWALVALSVAVLLAFLRKEPLGWYVLWIMPFVGVYPKRYVVIPALLVSLSLLVRYFPYLYFGEYSAVMLHMRTILTVIPLGGLVVYGIWEMRAFLKRRRFA